MTNILVFQNRRRIINAIIPYIIFFFGLTVNIIYSGIGFMPLDQSIVFDGAWRISQGQTPYTDFYLPNGLVPIYLQSLFFIVLKPSYLSYCLHSSIFNGLFSILTYFFLLPILKNRTLSFLYSCATAFTFYPPMGTPYYDQHSFFFILATWLTISKLKSNVSSNEAFIFGIMTSILYNAALLSKQVPAVFFIPILGCILIQKYFQNNKTTLAFLVSFSATWILIFVSFYISINVTSFQTYALELPSIIGKVRTIEIINNPTKIISNTLDPLTYVGLNFVNQIFKLNIVFFTLCGLAFVYTFVKPNSETPLKLFLRRLSPNINLSIISFALLMICFLYNAFTKNDVSNGIPFIFISLGLLHKIGLNWIKLFLKFLSQVYEKKNSIPKIIKFFQKFGPIIFGIIMIYFLANSTFRFDRTINKTRITSNLYYNSKERLHSPDPPLNFLKMENGSSDHVRTDELNGVMEFFSKNIGNFFLFGDSSILYGATGRPSIFPSLWIHPGLTYPNYSSLEFNEYDSLILFRINYFKVKYFIIEGENTYMNTRLEDFPIVNKYFHNNYCYKKTIGKFQIHSLCSESN